MERCLSEIFGLETIGYKSITHIRPKVVNTNSKKIQLRAVFLEKTVFLVRKK